MGYAALDLATTPQDKLTTSNADGYLSKGSTIRKEANSILASISSE